MIALRGLSNPSRWRFFRKNSETEISRCFFAMLSAVSLLAVRFAIAPSPFPNSKIEPGVFHDRFEAANRIREGE